MGQCDRYDQIIVKSFASTVMKYRSERKSKESLKKEYGN